MSKNWRQKVEVGGQDKLDDWAQGEEAPAVIRCFVTHESLNKNDIERMRSLGVIIGMLGNNKSVLTIPSTQIKNFCEFDFIVKVTFPQKLKPY